MPIENPKSFEENLNTSPNSLCHVLVSDSESIFDTPRKNKLKRDLRNTTAAKTVLHEKNKQLKRQCR